MPSFHDAIFEVAVEYAGEDKPVRGTGFSVGRICLLTSGHLFENGANPTKVTVTLPPKIDPRTNKKEGKQRSWEARLVWLANHGTSKSEQKKAYDAAVLQLADTSQPFPQELIAFPFNTWMREPPQTKSEWEVVGFSTRAEARAAEIQTQSESDFAERHPQILDPVTGDLPSFSKRQTEVALASPQLSSNIADNRGFSGAPVVVAGQLLGIAFYYDTIAAANLCGQLTFHPIWNLVQADGFLDAIGVVSTRDALLDIIKSRICLILNKIHSQCAPAVVSLAKSVGQPILRDNDDKPILEPLADWFAGQPDGLPLLSTLMRERDELKSNRPAAALVDDLDKLFDHLLVAYFPPEVLKEACTLLARGSKEVIPLASSRLGIAVMVAGRDQQAPMLQKALRVVTKRASESGGRDERLERAVAVGAGEVKFPSLPLMGPGHDEGNRGEEERILAILFDMVMGEIEMDLPYPDDQRYSKGDLIQLYGNALQTRIRAKSQNATCTQYCVVERERDTNRAESRNRVLRRIREHVPELWFFELSYNPLTTEFETTALTHVNKRLGID
jgi:hypothetical protein